MDGGGGGIERGMTAEYLVGEGVSTVSNCLLACLLACLPCRKVHGKGGE
jgi:hypothetical protein